MRKPLPFQPPEVGVVLFPIYYSTPNHELHTMTSLQTATLDSHLVGAWIPGADPVVGVGVGRVEVEYQDQVPALHYHQLVSLILHKARNTFNQGRPFLTYAKLKV